MKKLLLLAMVAFMGFSSGCALFKPMTPEEQAAYDARREREAVIARAQLRIVQGQEHLASNLQNTVPGTNVTAVIQTVEKAMAAKGYACHDNLIKDGFGQTGMRCDCSKNKQTDLGASVGLNVLTNMLGGDRGKIIKEEIDECSIPVRVNWGGDGWASAGVVGFDIYGKRYKINQNNQHVEENEYNSSDRANVLADIRAALGAK